MFILNAHPKGLNTFCVTFLPGNEARLASAGEEGVCIWDLVQQKELLRLELGGESPSSLTCSPDGRHLAIAFDRPRPRFYIWDWAANKVEQAIALEEGSRLQCALFSPNGKSLTLAGARGVGLYARDYSIREYNTATWKPRRRLLRGHTDQSGFLAYSPDGRLLASGAADSTTILWDMVKYQELATFKHRSIVWEMAFSPDGSILATADGSAIRLIDVAKRKPRRGLLRGHKKFVYGMAFTNDGRHLASVGGDGILRLWNVESRRLARQFDWEVGPLHCVRFSPDGNLGVVGAANGQIVVWDLDD